MSTEGIKDYTPPAAVMGLLAAAVEAQGAAELHGSSWSYMGTVEVEYTDLPAMWLHWSAAQRRLWRQGDTRRRMFA